MRPAFYVLLGVLLVPTIGLVGDIVTDGAFKSTKLRGAPLEVASSDMVASLNADMVDGVEGTELYTKAEVDALVEAVTNVCAPRQYYLTDASYATNEALTACAGGFHFANLYEILDVSNLKYANSLRDALTRADSGSGPPTFAVGWVRTGWVSDLDPGPGDANCLTWRLATPEGSGSVAWLSKNWGGYDGVGWVVYYHHCGAVNHVWCIQD